MSAYADLGTLWINIGAKNKTGEEFDKIRQSAAKVGKDVEALGKKFTNYLTLPLIGLGALAINEFAKFESSMSKVQATTQATSSEMAILTAKARELGKSTIYSAEDVAEAMNYMAMAGWDTSQIIDGLGGVLDLAAASGGDLATVSDIVTDALTAFGLGASDTTDFVDLLANVARTANTNVELLGESFKYVAPVSASLGITAEQTALALGLLANNGIKGSQAGTTLRAALNQLIKPSNEAAKLMKQYGIAVQTADDGSVDLMATIGSLKQGISGLSREQQAQVISTLVGTEAMSGMMALINSTEADVNKLTEATTNYSGSAKEMAETMNNNVKGNLNELKSAFSELLIVVGENLVPIFTKLIEKATEVVEWFGSLDEGTQGFIVKMGLLSAAIGPVVSTIGKLISGGEGLIKVFTAGAGGAGGFATALGGVSTAGGATGALGVLSSLASFLTGPWGLAIGAGGLALAGLNMYMQETATMTFDETVQSIQGLSDETQQMVIEVTEDWATLTTNVSDYLTDIESRTEENLTTINETMNTKTAELIELEQQKLEERKQLFGDYTQWTTEEGALFYEEVLSQDQQSTQDRIDELNRLNEERQMLIANYDSMTYEEQLAANARIAEINNEFCAEEIGLKARTADEILALIESKGALTEAAQIEFAQHEIQRANEVRDAAISAADEEYEARVLAVANMKGLSEEQKSQMIRDAQDIRTQTVSEANEQKREVVDVLGKTYPELYKILDYNTGEMSNRWQQFGKQMVSDHEGEMHNLDLIMAESVGNAHDVYTDMKKGVNENLKDINKEQKKVGEQATKMGDNIKSSGKVSADGLKKPIEKVETLHKKIDLLPSKKTVSVTVNETTNKRTKVYASENVARSYALRDAIGTHDFEGLYNLTAFNTGFNPSDEIAKYENNEKVTNNTQAISTKNLEGKLDKLLKYIKEFGSMKVFLDKYTLVGELAPEMSKEIAKGVRFR